MTLEELKGKIITLLNEAVKGGLQVEEIGYVVEEALEGDWGYEEEKNTP
jgi:hypothetical protein